MPRHRIFIAIDLPEELKDVCEEYLKPFFNNKNIRIPQRDGWHITVSFLGYLADEEIAKLKEIVQSVCQMFKPFEIRPDKIIFAPPLGPKRMIWLEFSAKGPLRSEASGFVSGGEILKSKIETALVSSREKGLFRGFRKENRTSHLHLTLARFPPEHFSHIKNFLAEEGIDLKNETLPFLVNEISIMESFLSRQGAEYQVIAGFKLKV